jgi:hypothetical protein
VISTRTSHELTDSPISDATPMPRGYASGATTAEGSGREVSAPTSSGLGGSVSSDGQSSNFQ